MDLAEISLFRGLAEEELSKIRRVAIKRTCPKGATVFMEGQVPDGLYFILNGLVKVYMLYKDGREKTLAIFEKGDFFGEMTLFGKEIGTATIETLELTRFLVMPRQEFQPLVQEIPTLASRIIETLAERLRQANRQIQELSFLNSRNRVIYNILDLAQMHGHKEQDEVVITLRLTHAELAKLAGVSRETVTKVLLELQDLELIKITDRRLKISSVDQLYREVM